MGRLGFHVLPVDSDGGRAWKLEAGRLVFGAYTYDANLILHALRAKEILELFQGRLPV